MPMERHICLRSANQDVKSSAVRPTTRASDWRYRVMPAPAPRVATEDPLQCQPASGKRAVGSKRLQGILRTRGREAAAPQRSEEKSLCRRKHPLIQAHSRNQNVLAGIHLVLFLHYFNNPAFRSVVKKSFSTAPKSIVTSDCRATSTRSTGCANSF